MNILSQKTRLLTFISLCIAILSVFLTVFAIISMKNISTEIDLYYDSLLSSL